jgi:hypothetical protein
LINEPRKACAAHPLREEFDPVNLGDELGLYRFLKPHLKNK